jgi:hypothetical protein
MSDEEHDVRYEATIIRVIRFDAPEGLSVEALQSEFKAYAGEHDEVEAWVDSLRVVEE